MIYAGRLLAHKNVDILLKDMAVVRGRRWLIVSGENGFVAGTDATSLADDATSLADAIALCLYCSSLAPRETIERREPAADWASVARGVARTVPGELQDEMRV